MKQLDDQFILEYARKFGSSVKSTVGGYRIEAEGLFLFSRVNGNNSVILGLPLKIAESGDPYKWQVEQTVKAVVEEGKISDDSWSICYQSRVGPLKWLEPSLDDELKRARRHNKNVLVVPIAFVSEHSETLVELDLEYRELATTLGIDVYRRVPAVGTHYEFIDGLCNLVENSFKETSPWRKTQECTVENSRCFYSTLYDSIYD